MMNQVAEYEKAASMMPGSVIIFQLQEDDRMRVFYYSKKAQELTGMEQAEVDDTVMPNGFNMIIEDDQRIIIDKVKQAILRRDELDVIYRQHHKKQGVVWIHMKAAIVGEVDGRPVFIASMLDVTHEMLNSSSIMEASDRSICVIEKHTKLLLYGNSRFYSLIDRRPCESMGVYCYDTLCGNPAFKHDNKCLCFSTINIDQPFEYYNPESKQYLSMYGREIMWGEHEAYVFFLTDQTEEKFKDKQLKNAQQRFEMTLENSGLFIWEYDIVNNQCINSQKAVRDYGIPLVIDNYPESLFEMGHTPPETVEQIKEVKQRLLRGETGFSVERRTIDKNGNSQWMKVSYALETDANGQPMRALVCGSDITEQKLKELEYEEEIRLKKTVTGSTTVLAILDLTADSVAENGTLSPLLADYLTLGSVNQIMQSVCDSQIVPTDRAAYKQHFSREQMLASYARGVMHDAFRHQFVHHVGWYESAYDLILNPSTGHVEAVTSIKDVSDEVRSLQMVKRLAAIDYEMVMTVDVETGDAYMYKRTDNEADDSIKRVRAVDYQTYTTAFIPEHCTPAEAKRFAEQTSREHILQMLRDTEIYSVLYTLTLDGQLVRKRNIYTYLDPSRKTVLCARQDVTDSYLQEEKQKKELSEALEKAEIANHAKTAFLSRVSHDMRTPLNGILGLTALMEDEVIKPEVMSDLKKLETSGKYLLDLINDVLDVSSIEAGKLELHPAVCDGRTVLSSIVKITKPAMDAKHIELVLRAEDMVFAPTFIDEARLQQVAINVLGNAAKFTPEDGRVEFACKTLSSEGGVIVNQFIIKDNGIGMDPAFVPHLFEPFSQENAAITNAKTGTGLGMSITKRIVELMNGTIQVESEKGVGTTVTVVLEFPLATDEQIVQSRLAAQPSQTSFHLEGKHVLLCEDHPLNREIARRLLEKVGVIVEHAENGKLGVAMFQASQVGHFDAILMDIRMPVMDGMEAARTIRSLDRSDAGRVPILAMTANALDDDIKNTAKAGMNAHLSKPIDPLKLYQNLDKYTNVQLEVGRMRILVVDDADANRAVVAAALKDKYDVIEAENGIHAMALLKKLNGIDLVITDIQMPEMDGFALVKQIRACDRYRHVAIIAYTDYEQPQQEERLLELGVNDFIYKPLNPKIVELRVHNAIARR